tara:strand:- start:300 stop:845 length:546 start_codon:yes stop_codon:yes gene_type:complete
MKLVNLFSDVINIKPIDHFDNRGYFRENFNYKELEKNGITFNSVQDNLSFSEKKGTIRGLHFQIAPFEQSKIIYVVKGKIFDVFVDLRPESNNFGNYSSIELSSDSGFVFIPKGFAHGFCTLEDNTTVLYKVDNYYNKESESGIIWNDNDLNIEWPIEDNKLSISEKDKKLNKFDFFRNNS